MFFEVKKGGGHSFNLNLLILDQIDVNILIDLDLLLRCESTLFMQIYTVFVHPLYIYSIDVDLLGRFRCTGQMLIYWVDIDLLGRCRCTGQMQMYWVDVYIYLVDVIDILMGQNYIEYCRKHDYWQIFVIYYKDVYIIEYIWMQIYLEMCRSIGQIFIYWVELLVDLLWRQI